MKSFLKHSLLAFAATAAGALGLMAWAQAPETETDDRPPVREGRRPPAPEGRRPPPPLETALDADQDGEISAGEIENAAAVLKKLDKNGDGKLTPEEYRPPRPPEDRDSDGRGPGFGRDGDDGPPPPRRDGRRRGPPDCGPGEGKSDGGPREGDFGRRGPPEDRGPEGRRGGPPRDGDRGPERPTRDQKAFADRVLQFDKNDDGKVDEDELPDEMRELMDRGDTNDDGGLDRAELERLAPDGRRPGRRPPPGDAGQRRDPPRRPAAEE